MTLMELLAMERMQRATRKEIDAIRQASPT